MDAEIEDTDLVETNTEITGDEVKDTVSNPEDCNSHSEGTVKDEKVSNAEKMSSDITETKGMQNASHKSECSQDTTRSTDQVFENGKRKVKEEKPPTKVVVRRLPPLMSKEVFLEQVSPLPPYDYMYFVSGDPSYGLNSFSRAYINFINQEDVFTFTRTFDNYVFLDAKGQEYPAIVEFSPFQRVPKQRSKKKDTLTGTIESDPMYITFKENLLAEALENSKPGAKTMKQHYFETEISTTEEINTTPLLEFLKQKRAEKARIRDERREEKKRKEAERKLKQKTKDKKVEVEEEETAKDVKIQHCTVSAEKSFSKGEYTLLLKSEKEKPHEKLITSTDNGEKTHNNLGTKEKFLNSDRIIIKKRKDRSKEVNDFIKESSDCNVNPNSDDTNAEFNFNTQDDSSIFDDEKGEAISLSQSRSSPNVCVLKKAEQQTQYLRKILGLSSEDRLSPTEMDSMKSVNSSKICPHKSFVLLNSKNAEKRNKHETEMDSMKSVNTSKICPHKSFVLLNSKNTEKRTKHETKIFVSSHKTLWCERNINPALPSASFKTSSNLLKNKNELDSKSLNKSTYSEENKMNIIGGAMDSNQAKRPFRGEIVIDKALSTNNVLPSAFRKNSKDRSRDQ